MIIDAYAHGFHGKYLDDIFKTGGRWAEEGVGIQVKRAKENPQYIDPAIRVEQLDRHGIDRQVVTWGPGNDVNLFPGDAAAKLAYAGAVNDNMARFMEESKGKLIAIGIIPIENFEQGGRQEMERAIKTLGLKGFSLTTNILGRPLDSPEFESFWAQAAEMDVAIYTHPWNTISQTDRSYEGEYYLMHCFGWPFETTLMLARLVFSGVIERYPTLKIVSHHLGGMIPFFWGRTQESCDPEAQQARIGRVMPQPLFDYFSRFYYDTAVGGSVNAIRCAYDVFGADQLVFATDGPWGPNRGEDRLVEYPEMIRSLGFSEEENEKIFSGNARKMLNLD